MMRSRVTLAMMLAAAIESERESPLTKASWGNGNPRTGRPSIRQWPGAGSSACAARAIARWVARRMLRRSISPQSASATDQRTSPWPVRNSKSASRRDALSFFESSRPGQTKPAGRITAAAATGPASGPRPASSIPAIQRTPRPRSASSNSRSGMTGAWLESVGAVATARAGRTCSR